MSVAEGEILLAACDYPGWVISRVDDAAWGNPDSGCNSTTTFMCARCWGRGQRGRTEPLLLALIVFLMTMLMMRCSVCSPCCMSARLLSFAGQGGTNKRGCCVFL